MPARLARTVGAALALVVLATACSGSSASTRTSGGALKVVAVENVWGDIARQIGGDHVSVTSILTDPSVDPHTYETDPRAAAAVSSAAFVIQNGLGYDEFASKLIRASSVKGRTVLTVSTVLGLSGDDVNPHLWYSPTYVTAAATAFSSQLSKADPAHTSAYAQGLAAFLLAYKPYGETLATIKATYSGTKVAYTERVAGYLLDAAGLQLGIPSSFPQAVEDGTDPSPADLAAVDAAMEDHTVKVLVYNAQVTSPVTDALKQRASSSGVAVVGVTESLPSGKDFQTWQTAQAKAVLAALAS